MKHPRTYTIAYYGGVQETIVASELRVANAEFLTFVDDAGRITHLVSKREVRSVTLTPIVDSTEPT